MRDCSGIGHGTGGDVFFCWKQLCKSIVDPIDNTLLRAEVDAKCERREAHAADAFMARTQIQTDFGLTEPIDRLHGVAHHEQRAAIVGLPTGGELGQQFMLAHRGVLKFVHQQMTNAIIEM